MQGVEGLVTRALVGTITARLLVVAVDGTASLFHAGGRFLEDIAGCAGYLEAHFGREYERLTGVDMARLLGDPGLYEGEPQTEELTEHDGDE